MRPEDILYWLNATPFKPFRITLNSGRSYDIRHPEFVRLLRTSLVIFTPSEVPDIYDRGEMIGLVLIERIAPLEPSAVSGGPVPPLP